MKIQCVLLWAVCGALTALGCGSESESGESRAGIADCMQAQVPDADVGGSDTCAGIADCMQAQVEAVVNSGCLPASDAQGVLSEDGLTCTYDSGHTVTFGTNMIEAAGNIGTGNDSSETSFELKGADGTLCFKYAATEGDSNESKTVETAQGSYSSSQQGEGPDAKFTLQCGGKTANITMASAMSCNLMSLPGYSADNSSGSMGSGADAISIVTVGFGISLDGGSGDVKVYSCSNQ